MQAATQQAQKLSAIMGAFLVDQEPGVIGSALAELMSRFLACHRIPDDPVKQDHLRTEILRTWCETVRALVVAQEADGAKLQ